MTSDRSLILSTSVRALFHVALLFSIFLLFVGHNAPGGGFIGGLVAGAAIVLRYVDGGIAEVRRDIRLPAPALLGTGLVVALVTGVVPWITGAEFLESGKISVEVPLFGTVKATSALPFDIGVYIVVVGLVVAVVDFLGGEAES